MTVNHLESGIELGSISMGEDAVDNDNRITPPTSVVATPPPVNSDDNSDNISGTDNSNDKNDPPPLNWEQYPESLTNFDPILYDAIQIRRDINQQSQSLFSNLVNLKVTDVTEEASGYMSKNLPLGRGNAEAHIVATHPVLRIISVMRKNSLAPLNITRELLLKILSHHQIQPCFLNMFFDLRKGERLSEKGHAFWAPFAVSDKSYQLCYQLRYVEKNDHRQGAPWSERQVGVYHKFTPKENATMVLLHASENTELQRRIEGIFCDGQLKETEKAKRPLLLHVLLISTYLDNWRWALQDYGQRCMQKEDQFLTTPLRDPTMSFRELQELRNTESKLVSAASVLQATLSIIIGLQSCERSLKEAKSQVKNDDDLAYFESPDSQGLKSLRLKCQGYLRSVEAVQNRINMLVSLLADGLNQQSQQNSTEIADSTYNLTQKSVSDSAIVKVVTVITLTYLPVQGVATFFGMNLSGLPAATNRIRFADNWWLFLAAAIPLTALTLGFLAFAMWRENTIKGSGSARRSGS